MQCDELSRLSVVPVQTEPESEPSVTVPVEDGANPVVFVGSNWDGVIDVIDGESYVKIGRINGIPDKDERMREIWLNPIKLAAFHGIALLIGEGHNQYVDDMYSARDASGENCFVSWSGTDQMSVINIERAEEVVRVDVGDHPQRIREGSVPDGWTTPF